MTPAPVIAISGHPGSGKTSLVKMLQAELGVPSIHYDDYETITSQAPEQAKQWIARGANYDEIMLEPLVHRMEQLAAMAVRPRCVLFDTPLGRAHRRSGAVIHTLLWIDTPPDIALARKIGAAAGRARLDPGQAVAYTTWLEKYLTHYTGFIAGTYDMQRERVRPGADIVLDGRVPLEALAAEAMAALTRRLGWHIGAEEPDGPPIGPRGKAMLALIEALDCPFGLERSAKLGDGAINEDRFLAIVHKRALGDDPAAGLAHIAGRLGLAGSMLDMLCRQLAQAEIVGLGYEGGDDPVYKIYLELSQPARRASSSGLPAGAEVIFSAVKWRADDPGRAVASRYVRPAAGRGPAAIAGRLAAQAGKDRRLASAQAALGIVEAARGRCPPERIALVEVEEEVSPRRSFDINVYAATLPVEAVSEPIRRLAAAYAIPPAEIDTFLARVGPLQLGHLSGGIGRNGRDFATLYFGAAARKGAGRG
jgi:hypothetical protein